MWANVFVFLVMGTTLAVVLSRRTMYSILFLILLFAQMALFVLSLKVDFIGLIFVIVYVGAIATLFLFIIMMLGDEDWVTTPAMDVETYNLLLGSGFRSNWLVALVTKTLWYLKHTALDILIAFMVGLSLMGLVSNQFMNYQTNWLDVAQISYSSSLFNNVYLYGVFFYNNWYIPFLLAAVVLLIAMLGSIILTTKLFAVEVKNSKNNNNQEASNSVKDTSNTDSSNENDNKLVDETNKAVNNVSKSELLIQKLMKAQKYNEKMAFYCWPLELMWTIFCFSGSYCFKNDFIVGAFTQVIYIVSWFCVYLMGTKMINKFGEWWLVKK